MIVTPRPCQEVSSPLPQMNRTDKRHISVLYLVTKWKIRGRLRILGTRDNGKS